VKIAIAGGTGDIGEGLTLRFARDTDHRLVVGSREAEKAQSAASEYQSRLETRGVEADISGAENTAAVTDADVVVLAVPPYHIGDTVVSIRDHLSGDQVVVSPAVGMRGDDDGLHYHPPGEGSVTELVVDRVPGKIPVVGAFHNLAAGRLSDLDAELGFDTLLVGDDADAKATVASLVEEVDDLRPLDAGPHANAAEVESVTPLLVNVARYSEGMHDLGVSFH
jgi:hypothetical protein